MLRKLVLLLFAAAAFTGCSRDPADIEKAENEQPEMRKASSIAETGNSAEAISLFYKALEKNPSWAKAHLELALLFHDIDQISAIYHYRRYLSLRPQTEKREMIEGRIRSAHLLLVSDAMTKVDLNTAGAQPENGARMKKIADEAKSLSDRIVALEKQNAELQRNVNDLEAKLKAERIAAREQASKPKIYKVKNGDTLSGIAGKFYQDKEKWRVIYEANKDKLAGQKSLKVGQALVIPMMGNAVEN